VLAGANTMPNIRANNSGLVPLPIVATGPESGHDVDWTGTGQGRRPGLQTSASRWPRSPSGSDSRRPIQSGRVGRDVTDAW